MFSENKTFCENTSQYCSELPPHSHYQSTDLHLLFFALCSNQFSLGFSLLKQQCCKLFQKYQYALKKSNSVAYARQISPSLGKTIPLNSFVLLRNFKSVQFPDKLKLLHSGPFRINIRPTEFMYELLTHFTNIENICICILLKNLCCFLFAVAKRF